MPNGLEARLTGPSEGDILRANEVQAGVLAGPNIIMLAAILVTLTPLVPTP